MATKKLSPSTLVNVEIATFTLENISSLLWTLSEVKICVQNH